MSMPDVELWELGDWAGSCVVAATMDWLGVWIGGG